MGERFGGTPGTICGVGLSQIVDSQSDDFKKARGDLPLLATTMLCRRVR